MSDLTSGIYAYSAILEAIIERINTKQGKEIKVSMFGAVADWMGVFLLQYDYAGKIPARVGLNHPFVHPYGAYSTKNGRPLLFSIQNEREFVQFCDHVLKMPHLPEDERFKNNVVRCANRETLDGIISELFLSLDYEELVARMVLGNIAYADVNTVADLAQHGALNRVAVQTPAGVVNVVAPPPQFDGKSPELGPVPSLGEHTDKIRNEFS